MKKIFITLFLLSVSGLSSAEWKVLPVDEYPNAYALANSDADSTVSIGVMCIGKSGPHIQLMSLEREFTDDSILVSWKTDRVIGEPSKWKVMPQQHIVSIAMPHPKVGNNIYKFLKTANKFTVSFLDVHFHSLDLTNFGKAANEFDRKCGF